MNRRDFLKAVALTAFSSSFNNPDKLFATNVQLDENIVAIFSDPHILHNPADSQQVVRFNQCVAKVLSMNPRPAKLIIYGDVAYSSGELESYELFRKLIHPVEAAGIQWEIAMGNHDRLENFQKVFPEKFTQSPLVEGRYVNIVETPHADFIILDSYLTGEVRGEISAEQQEWLKATLKKYTKKPVFVGCHHQLENTKIESILQECPKFIAYIHGHRHYYRTPMHNGIQTICFPSTGHWGDMGFMLANLEPNQVTFTPNIDAYQWSKYGYITEPEKDIEKYLQELNDNSPTFVYPQ